MPLKLFIGQDQFLCIKDFKIKLLMITNEKKIVMNVIKQLDGMNKIDAHDVLHQAEKLLHDITAPIQFNEVKCFFDDISKIESITEIETYSIEDQCFYINIYKPKPLFSKIIKGRIKSFTTYKNNDLNDFNNENIQKAFNDTQFKYIVNQFLKDNHVKKRNPLTNRFLLLELLEQVAPSNT